MFLGRRSVVLCITALLSTWALSACGSRDDSSSDKKATAGATSPGITDKEIKIGGSFPFSGPVAAYGATGRSMGVAFKEVNDAGGINGRKVNFIQLDDQYDPTKTVQMTRQLVEKDKVFAIHGTVGTPNNLAIVDYLNQVKVPQALVGTGATKLGATPDKLPWSMGYAPPWEVEGGVYASFLKDKMPNAKVAVLYQNDDLGKNPLAGFKRVIAGSGVKIVAEQSYDATDTTVTSQIGKLSRSGADVYISMSTPPATLQALKAIDKTGWKPTRILNTPAANTEAVLKPYGLGKAKGIISVSYFKDPGDAKWADDPDVQAYAAAIKKYDAKDNPSDFFTEQGYAWGKVMIEVLKNMKEPTRASLMESLRSMDIQSPLMVPGVKIQTSADRGFPVQSEQIQEFDGTKWVLQGEPIDGSAGLG